MYTKKKKKNANQSWERLMNGSPSLVSCFIQLIVNQPELWKRLHIRISKYNFNRIYNVYKEITYHVNVNRSML